MANPEIHILVAPNVEGLPLSTERFVEVGLADPQAMLDALGAQAVAAELLPCVNSQSRHWRYYLLAVPNHGRGRKYAVPRRLLRILDQNVTKFEDPEKAERFGICRSEWRHLKDRRRKVGPLLTKLGARFEVQYGAPTGAFWDTDSAEQGVRIAPSEALLRAARTYLQAEDFTGFFHWSKRSDALRRMVHLHLRAFRPQLANLLEARSFDLRKAVRAAPRWAGLTEEDRHLFLTWSLVQAYYGFKDEGLEPEDGDDADDESDQGTNSSAAQPDVADQELDAWLRSMAKAALALLRVVKRPGNLNVKQIQTIRHRLEQALASKGVYSPPELIYRTKASGRRRRVFPGLRLSAYANLLQTTLPRVG